MPKISREQVAVNRKELVKAAGRLFRQKGVEGVGIAELCEAAGFTTGALYSHFDSKEALTVEAFKDGREASNRRMEKIVGTRPSVAHVLDYYVSKRHRDNLTDCCPMLASASEAYRQSISYKEAYVEAFRELSQMIKSTIEGDGMVPGEHLHMVIAASMIGVVSVARTLKASSPALSDMLLKEANEALSGLASSSLN